MSGGLCNKCHSWIPLEGDTWCVGCTSAEELRQEILRPWAPPYRRIAHDLLISTVRQLKSLRALSTGLRSQLQSEAAKKTTSTAGDTAVRAKREHPSPDDPRGELLRRRTTTPKRKPAQASPVRAPPDDHSSEESEETEEEEERKEVPPGPDPHHRPLGGDPNRKPPEPDHPPPSKGKETSVVIHERRDRSSAKESRHHGKEKKQKDRGRRPGHRAGRKHQRLYRLLQDPSQRVHQRPSEGFWALQETFGCERNF